MTISPGPFGGPPRPYARTTLRVLLATLMLLAGAFGRLPAARISADDMPAPTGLLATLSATVENPESTDPSAPQGLLIQITLDNQTGAAIDDLAVASPIPAGTHVTDSWLQQPDQQTGQQTDGIQGQTIGWTRLSVGSAAQLGPLAYRIIPDHDADGATIFVNASLQPSLSWTGASGSEMTVPVLPLNGLWGEEGLRRTVLPSGLTIFTQERPDTPTVALRLAVRAGSRDEDDTNCGGSHWIEHAQYLGTPDRPDNQAIGGAIESIGGEFNAETDWEATDFWDLVPADKFDVAVAVLSDQMLHTTFETDAVEREKQVVIQETAVREDNPSLHAFDDFTGIVFQTSPLRHSPAAVSCLPGLSASAMLVYRAQHYVTGDIAIDASGDLNHDAAVAMISKAFAGLPVGPEFVRPAAPEPVESQLRIFIDGDGTTGTDTLRLGWPVAGISSADWAPMVILSDILGATGDRLAQAASDSGTFVSGTGADYLDYSDAGALMLSATTASNNLTPAVALFLAQVQRIRNGDLSDADVQAAVQATAGARALASELNLDQSDRATNAVSGTLQSYDEALARLQAVQPADVQRVAQTYLDPSSYSLVIYQQ